MRSFHVSQCEVVFSIAKEQAAALSEALPNFRTPSSPPLAPNRRLAASPPPPAHRTQAEEISATREEAAALRDALASREAALSEQLAAAGAELAGVRRRLEEQQEEIEGLKVGEWEAAWLRVRMLVVV